MFFKNTFNLYIEINFPFLFLLTNFKNTRHKDSTFLIITTQFEYGTTFGTMHTFSICNFISLHKQLS